MAKARPPSLAKLKSVLPDLLAWWRTAKVRGLVIGGLAVALWGRPRATRDIDGMVLVQEDDWQRFFEHGATFGFVGRIRDPLAFARNSRVLLLEHRKTQVPVDISLGQLEFEEMAMTRRKELAWDGIKIPVASVEDLIIMKAVARRDVDIRDIEGLLDANPQVDATYILRWVDEMAGILEIPEIYLAVEKMILARRTAAKVKLSKPSTELAAAPKPKRKKRR